MIGQIMMACASPIALLIVAMVSGVSLATRADASQASASTSSSPAVRLSMVATSGVPNRAATTNWKENRAMKTRTGDR